MNGYQVDLGGQYYTTLISVAVGVALCLLYDVFRIFRMTHRQTYISVFIQDVLYCFLASVITYGMLLVRCSGVVRFYPLLGEFFGFLICRFTLSRLIMIVAQVICRVMSRVLSVINRAIFTPIRQLAVFVAQKIEKIAKKIIYLLKNLLKHTAPLVYNHLKLHHRSKSDEGT